MITLNKYASDSLQSIKNSNFLSEEDFNAIQTMQEELQDTYEKRQIWRTETEMMVSVLNNVKFPTKASKYWQAVKEQAVFFENLATLSFEYQRNILQVKRILKKLETTEDELDREELEIDLKEAEFKKKNMEIAAKDRMRELKLWSKIKDELNDGSFDDKDVNNHQLISYGQRFINEALLAGNNGSPSENRNIQGLVQTTLKACQEKGVMDKVLEGLPEEHLKILERSNVLKSLDNS